MNASVGANPRTFIINQVSQAENYFTRLNYNNCPRFKAAYDDVNTSDEYKAARGYFYENYKEDLGNLVNKEDMTWDQFDATCEYMFFSQWTDIKLTFEPSEFDRQYC